MQKRSYFINNPSSELLRIIELNLSLPPGLSNLFELNEELSYEQIEFSVKNGTLGAAIENGLCYPMPDPINQKSLSDGVLLRNSQQIQALPSRARFVTFVNNEATVFDAADNNALFGEEEVKPARELEREMKTNANSLEQIEATIKQANIAEKPIENRYIPPDIKTSEAQQKIKNDITMGYVTCEGITLDGKRCMRRAKKNKLFCGKHNI